MAPALLLFIAVSAEPSGASASLDRLVGTWSGRVDTVVDDRAVKATLTWNCARALEKAVQCRRSTVLDDAQGTTEDLATYGFDAESKRFNLLVVDDQVERQYTGGWKTPSALELKREADDAVTTTLLTFTSEKKLDLLSSRTEAGKTTTVAKGTMTRQGGKK